MTDDKSIVTKKTCLDSARKAKIMNRKILTLGLRILIRDCVSVTRTSNLPIVIHNILMTSPVI